MTMLPIRYLTIHCAATPEGRNVPAATVEAWDIAKFGQKSYHWIVLLDGTKHRSLADDVRGAHVAKANTGNIGICYVGGMDANMANPKDTRTPAQLQSLRELVNEYRAQYPHIVIRGHRDWPGVNKACPSFDVAHWLASFGAGPPVTPAPVSGSLKRGDHGPEVVKLQQALATHGNSIHLTVDGDFGPATESAVKAFQSAHGLTADGIIGPKTRSALGI